LRTHVCPIHMSTNRSLNTFSESTQVGILCDAWCDATWCLYAYGCAVHTFQLRCNRVCPCCVLTGTQHPGDELAHVWCASADGVLQPVYPLRLNHYTGAA
jgi:hypothetical protein